MMTKRQRDTLAFIARYQTVHPGLSPSMVEIQEALGLSSKSGVVRLLDGLQERGAIRRLRSRARSIEILRPDLVPAGKADPLYAVCRRMLDWAKSGNGFSYPPGCLQELEQAVAEADAR